MTLENEKLQVIFVFNLVSNDFCIETPEDDQLLI